MELIFRSTAFTNPEANPAPLDLASFTLSLIAAAAGILALLCWRRGTLATWTGVSGTLIATLAGIFFLCTSSPPGLLLLFMLPTLILGPAAALHSVAYIKGHGNPGIYWGFFNLTLGTMLALPLIRSFVPFLIVWELMGIFSFVLVMFNYKAEELKRVAWIYLLACEAGGLLLMLFYALSLKEGVPHCLIYAAGVAGFGLKAGFPLLHLWLPEAHPAAPAPVSAVMSGAMINLGLFGLLCFVFPTCNVQLCGWTLLILGCIGSLGGIVFAITQDNLKRLLAYSSIENIGIMSMGFGFGFLGAAHNNSLVAFCGFAGGFLHLINHALLKGGLFLCAGNILKAVHTLDMDKMGGLVKKLPRTGMIFTFSAMGISGLPPFCGFSGELLIYLAAFNGIAAGSGWVFAASTAAAVALALTGGTAAAAFAKTVSAVFSGESRTAEAVNAAPEQENMVAPQMFLSVLAAAMTISAP